MPFKNIIDIIIYIIPGFIMLQLYRSYYPVKDKKDFYEISWSIIGGVIITSFVKILDQKYFNFYLESNTSGFPSFYLIITLIFTGICIGYSLILIHKFRFILSSYEKLKWLLPDPQSIWAKINHPSNMDWSVVFLNDGAIYLGWIKYYKFDPNRIEHDFLLTKAKRVDEKLKTIYSIDGIGIYINIKDVNRIEYVKGQL